MVPFRLPNQETLTIEKLVYGGEGLARQEGKVVLLPFVLPGETIRAETERAKNDLWRGRLLEVLAAIRVRVTAKCPYFQRCGGCQYQHIEYPVQLEQKREILRETLLRGGKIEFAGEIGVIASEPWQYRNRVQLHIQDGNVGYFAQGSRELVAIDHCPIASPKLNEAIPKLKETLAGFPPVSTAIELFTNETDVQVNVMDRVPRPVSDCAYCAGRVYANRLPRLPGEPEFVLPGEPLADRCIGRLRPGRFEGRLGGRSLCRRRTVFSKAGGTICQGDIRRIEQYQLSRFVA